MKMDFKKKKAYEIENLVVVEKGQTNGVAADQFICERKGTTKTIKCPDTTTKIYINKH